MLVRNYRDVEAETSEDAKGVTVRWVVAKRDGAPRFAMRVIDVQPGCATPHHEHWWEHEVFVLAGKGVVKGKGGDKEISEGAVVFIPGEEKHQFVNTGADVLRFLCMVPHA
jgi:quercetin dioxygenase-like cupin family protein